LKFTLVERTNENDGHKLVAEMLRGAEVIVIKDVLKSLFEYYMVLKDLKRGCENVVPINAGKGICVI